MTWVAQDLHLSRSEIEFLPQLAGMLPTPRAMKKFTNLYRLLRLGVRPTEVPAFCGNPTTREGPYQAAALLLAVLTSDIGPANNLFTRLTVFGTELHEFGDIVDTLSATHITDPQERARLACDPATRQLLHAITDLRVRGTAVHGPTATYQRWAHVVARYSFETYHLYTEPPADS